MHLRRSPVLLPSSQSAFRESARKGPAPRGPRAELCPVRVSVRPCAWGQAAAYARLSVPGAGGNNKRSCFGAKVPSRGRGWTGVLLAARPWGSS